MNYKKSFIIILFIIIILGINIVSAAEDTNLTQIQGNSSLEISEEINVCENEKLESLPSQEPIQDDGLDEIIVNNWDELQYYCSLTDKDYTLRLKENTNFYPTDIHDSNYQIKINNNVKIIGSSGSYFGDSAPNHHLIWNGSKLLSGRFISYTPIIVPDGNQMDLTLENITFKWICTLYTPDAIVLQMGGDGNYLIKNCAFYDINTNLGHSCIVYLKKGDALLENCSFINCTTDFGCVSLYNKVSFDNARMVVKDCYFENNYANTEPGCINNCAVLTVYNTTFYKNRAYVWAGAIHTHYYAVANIYNSTFIDNVAGWNGGALYTYSYLNIYNTSFIGNNCTTNNGGGAIGACKYESAPYIYIEGCLFENNANNCWRLDELSTSGTGRGGAISLMDEGSLEVRDTLFIANSASIGTAICAVGDNHYGYPDVIIVNNTFINHTRVGDVLNVRVVGTICNISDNYYLGNSIEFSTLSLKTLSQGNEQATLQITAKLSNPSYYDSDILKNTLYDVYVNDEYVKTVNSTKFTVDFGDLDICKVYVIPTISNQKSNEVTITSTREYVFVSQSNGNDNNNGVTRNKPVKSIKKALELAINCKNIILLDGLYNESDLTINYDLALKGEGNATLTGATSFIITSNQFNLKNLAINNLTSNNFIIHKGENISISNVIITGNNVVNLINGNQVTITDSIIANNDGLILNNTFTSVRNSILLNNSNLIVGAYDLDYNWWGNILENFQTNLFNGINNWLVLNATADTNELEINQIANVNFAFYLMDNNHINKYANLRNIYLILTSINGSSVNLTSSNSNIAFKLTALSDGELIAKYHNIETHVGFKFIKSNPNVKVNYDNILVDDDLIVKISLPNDISGNLTISVSNQSQFKVIDSNNLVFNFTDMVLNYSGDEKYRAKEIISRLIVSKHPSFTNLNLSEINVGEDLIITITAPSDATGNVSLYINNKLETLTLNESKANYAIKNITRGDYRITAIYNGDDKYLESSDYRFIEVDNINSTLSSIIEDITYGENVCVQIFLNDDATGNVSVTIDGVTNSSAVLNGRTNITFSGIDAGFKEVSIFYTGDDTYFNKTENSNFTINKANLSFTIVSSDIMVGQDAIIYIKVSPKTAGTFTIGEDIIHIPLSGDMAYIMADLEIGDYIITAVYNGNNYFTVDNSTEFSVIEYTPAQWRGDDETTRYGTDVNGEINYLTMFNSTVNNLAVDSEGNIIVSTSNGIYSFKNDGCLNWAFESGDYLGNYSGIVIGRDVIVSPRSGDTLYFIEQSSGYNYGSSNLYQGSSLFAPSLDSNFNLYIASEYQYSSGSYKLVKIPYRAWENGGQITLIDLGNYKPLSSPVVGDNIIVVLSEGRLRVLDSNSLLTKFIMTGNFASVKPVTCENIVYLFVGDAIVAYDIQGTQLWKTKVTGGAGNQLVLGSDSLYATNAKGNLYRYDLVNDGKEHLVSGLSVTSDILIDADGNLYFGSDNFLYCINPEGNVMWKSDLSAKIMGSPVMDENGIIYVATIDNKLFALSNGNLKDCGLKVSVNDIVQGESAIVDVRLDGQATGSVSFSVNGVRYDATVGDGNVVKVISNLPVGTYNVNVTYSGDLRFNKTSEIVTFTVKTKPVQPIQDPVLTASDVTLLYTSGSYYTVRLTQNSLPLRGKAVAFSFNGVDYTVMTDANGIASFKITAKPGKYTIKASYQGKTIRNTVTVKSIIQAKNLKVKKSAKSVKIKVTLKKVNNKFLKNKKITLKFNGKTLKAKTNKKGVATFKISKSILKKLKKGKKYTYTVTYQKDSVKKSLKVK